MKNNVNKILVLFFVIVAIGFSQDNYSLSFDGEDDYVDFGSGSTFNLENFTMSTWFKTTWSSNQGGDWINIMGSQDKYALLLVGIHNEGGCKLRFTVEPTPGAGVYGNIESQTDVSDGNWHHVAVTRNNSTGKFKMYLDGSYVGSNEDVMDGQSQSIDLSGTLTIYAPFQIGAWNTSGRAPYD